MIRMFSFISIFWLFVATAAFSEEPSAYLVIGAIGSSAQQGGVVLLKNTMNQSAFAVRVGAEVEPGTTVFQIADRYVYFKHGSSIKRVKIGESLEQNYRAASLNQNSNQNGVEVHGGSVKITSQYKDYLVKEQLSKVLMQAAAVPVYESGFLQGFKLLDIDEGSIYQQVGFQNGDIVTEINGQTLSDVGMTVKVLNAMRSETNAVVRYLRSGESKTLEINVD